MILVVDNYDSFTYNLVQALAAAGARVEVVRNDALRLEELFALEPQGLVVSPGPGRPEAAGFSVAAIRHWAGRIPVLGVCLGHQAIAVAFGGRVGLAPEPMHGKTSEVYHDGRGLFAGLPNPFVATRYHSLAVERAGLPESLEVSAETADGVVMGVRHRRWPVEGVQFHPESILTPAGAALLSNFVRQAGGGGR